jgi:ethanolaminephosphotransferase
LYGICLLVYQTLDNLDGRQARRTGSSSPLGLLFDHCADALCTAVGSISTCATFGLANEHPLAPLALVSAVCVPLALSTWEQLCTGVFRLPTVNAPSDGLLAQALLMLFTAVLGPGL